MVRLPTKHFLVLCTAGLFVFLCCFGVSKSYTQSTGGQQEDLASQQSKRSGSPKDQKAAPSLAPSPEEQYLLMKLQIERELQDDILTWAQTRFWIIAVLSVVVGFVGVRSLVREMLSAELKDAMRASAEASAAAGQGKEAVKEVRAEAAKYSTTMEELTASAAKVDQKLSDLRSRVDAEGTRSVAAAELKTGALEAQLAELRKMVEVLAKDSEGTKRVLVEFENRRVQAERSAALTQADFDENSTVEVQVVGHGPGSATQESAARLVEALSKLGFKASSGRWAEGHPIGSRIRISYKDRAAKQAELVQKVITTAFDEGWIQRKPIEMEPRLRPLGGTDNDVVVFF